MLRALLLALTLALPGAAHAVTYYVNAATGGDFGSGKDGLSVANAFKQNYQAQQVVLPGDNVCLLSNAPHPSFSINARTDTTHFGTSSQHITYRGCSPSGVFNTTGSDLTNLKLVGARPIMYNPAGSNVFTLQIKGNNTGSTANGNIVRRPLFIDFVGIEFQGTNVLNGRNNPVRGAAGVGVESSEEVGFYNNMFSWAGNNGAATEAAESIRFYNNDFHDNAYYIGSSGGGCVFGSGASILRTYNWRNSTSGDTVVDPVYRMIFVGNRMWNNWNDPSTKPSCGSSISDGNGLIFDRNDGSCENGLGCTASGPNGGAPLPKYLGAMLIANNQIWHSGGPAIHLYLSAGPVDVFNNSTYMNKFPTATGGSNEGEISVLVFGGCTYDGTNPNECASSYTSSSRIPSAARVRIENNIMVTNSTCDGTVTSGNCTSKRGFRRCLGIKSQTISAVNSPVLVKNNLCHDTAGGTNATNQAFHINTSRSPSNSVAPNIVAGTFKFGNPNYVSANLTSSADFRIGAGSAALGFVSSAGEFYPTDAAGVTRTASSVTAGAFQKPYPDTVVVPPVVIVGDNDTGDRGPMNYNGSGTRYLLLRPAQP